ncbi:sulfatase-like hydrolase/transferase [Oxalobacter formigenes]|uniref:sulfatase-like hydrolase/transferase n=1 Tax=Oxalobacter formigenes TaxID=847 RepID=UPI0022AE8685|nr:sulfatase-like hydrolase/transferase [Oxalobacter formigenes]WAW05483.1 sulfatase-like hydrolase/transferase [Oxalobacter formigenes]
MSIKKARSSFNGIFDFPDHSFSFQSRARTTVFSFFTIFAFLLLFLVIVRWCQQSNFINNAIAPDLIQHDDLQRMWIMGLRFDGRTISICLLPAFLISILAIILIYTLIRGSMTSRYPLRRNNAQVSVIKMLTKTVPNGPIAFAWALSDFHKNRELEKVPGNELHELLKQANLDSLYGKTPKNDWLAVNKPNVIFCLMESMGQNMLTYDHLPETDLLGNLRKHFEKDFIFRRFISEDIHTIQSFSALFFISPISNLSTSMLSLKKLPDTPFENYKKAGYKTVFVTPGTKTWERMGDYLKVQGIDEIYDQTDLMDRYKLTDVSE